MQLHPSLVEKNMSYSGGKKLWSLVRFDDFCEFAEFVLAERSVEHCHSTNPAGEADAAAAVDDAADREWPAALGVLRCVQIVRILTAGRRLIPSRPAYCELSILAMSANVGKMSIA